jgi:hypothetical protein
VKEPFSIHFNLSFLVTAKKVKLLSSIASQHSHFTIP